MTKKSLVYDPRTKSFRPEEEMREVSPDGVAKPGRITDEEEQESEDSVLNKPMASEPPDQAQENAHWQTKSPWDKKGSSRQIQFVLWICIGVGLSLWIALVSIFFIADGQKLEPRTPSVELKVLRGQ